MFKKLVLALLPIFIYTIGLAQVDTIRLSNKELAIANVRTGLHQYLIYFDNAKKNVLQGHSLWNRNVAYKTVNGEEMIEIEQTWYSSDTLKNRYVYSLNRKRDFSPLYHYTKNAKGVEAYFFTDGEVTNADSVRNNSKKDFHVPLKTPTLNWELDLETFPMLPIKKIGQRFIINFYHPGDPGGPKYYEYKVTGSEKLVTAAAPSTDCWLLKINYDKKSYAIFWISKTSKEVLKMEEQFQGRYRYKVKLSTPVNKAR